MIKRIRKLEKVMYKKLRNVRDIFAIHLLYISYCIIIYYILPDIKINPSIKEIEKKLREEIFLMKIYIFLQAFVPFK